jgi:hypothetical protein
MSAFTGLNARFVKTNGDWLAGAHGSLFVCTAAGWLTWQI